MVGQLTLTYGHVQVGDEPYLKTQKSLVELLILCDLEYDRIPQLGQKKHC